MLRIILRRFGKRKLPFFQIVVCSRTKKNRWLFKDRVGFIKKAGTIRFMGLDVQRLSYWLLRGADYCTSLVKYFAFYTRMHKFEWRTYSKNFKRTDKKLLQEDLVNNLLWKWLSYKTKGNFKDNFRHLKILDTEQDFDHSLSDFRTYITWKYNKMRKHSGLFSEDENRYKLRLNNRKYYIYYVQAFNKFLNKQKRNLFRFNILNKFKTIDALKQDLVVGKLRRRFQKFSYTKFLKTYKHLPSFTDFDLWSFDSVKPVERYITLMSTYIQKYNPLKDYIFSLNFRFNFFSIKNIKLLYAWKKNWEIFNASSSKMLNVNNSNLLKNYKSFGLSSYKSLSNTLLKKYQNFFFKFYRNSVNQSQVSFLMNRLVLNLVRTNLNSENQSLLFLSKNKNESFLELKYYNFNIFQQGLNDIFCTNISLKKQKFKKFVSAFNEEIGGPYFFKKTQLYNELVLKYSKDSEKFSDLKKKHFLIQAKIIPTNKIVDFFSKSTKAVSNANFLIKSKDKYSNSNFSLNFENKIRHFSNIKKFQVLKKNSYFFKTSNPIFRNKRNINVKNLKFFKQYTFFKKYKYENLYILNKYVILLKYTTTRLLQGVSDNHYLDSKCDALLNHKNLILNLIKNKFIINWLLFLKSYKYVLFLTNLRSDFFINYFFKHATQLIGLENLKYSFWTTIFKKKYFKFFLTKSYSHGANTSKNDLSLMNIRKALFNKFIFKFKTFVSYKLNSSNNFSFEINKNVIINLVNYLKYKFSILVLLFDKREHQFVSFFKDNLSFFDIVIHTLQDINFLKNDLIFQLYQVFLNIQTILFDLESVLVRITKYDNAENIVKNSLFNFNKNYPQSNNFNMYDQKKKEIDLLSVIYLRNFFYFNNDSITNVSVNNLFTKSIKLKNLFRNKILHQLFLTNKFSSLLKSNRLLISNMEGVFNKLVFKFDFEYLWQKIYNLFLKYRLNHPELAIISRKKLLRSKFKMFFLTNVLNSNFVFFKKKKKLWQTRNIFSKFKGFLFLKENLVNYLLAIMKYNYFWVYLLSYFKKSFFFSSVNQNLKIYLFFLTRTVLQWDSFKENLENTKFVFNYDILLKQLKDTLNSGLHNNINYERQSLYSTFSKDGFSLFEKSLDMYIWNLLLKNNHLFFEHKQKFLSILGFFKLSYKFKSKFYTLRKKLGYFPFLGKYFKMYFLSILQLLRYLNSNNYLKSFLFLKLHKIRKQFKLAKVNKIDLSSSNQFNFNLKWKTTLFKYQNIAI